MRVSALGASGGGFGAGYWPAEGPVKWPAMDCISTAPCNLRAHPSRKFYDMSQRLSDLTQHFDSNSTMNEQHCQPARCYVQTTLLCRCITILCTVRVAAISSQTPGAYPERGQAGLWVPCWDCSAADLHWHCGPSAYLLLPSTGDLSTYPSLCQAALTCSKGQRPGGVAICTRAGSNGTCCQLLMQLTS